MIETIVIVDCDLTESQSYEGLYNWKSVLQGHKKSSINEDLESLMSVHLSV